MQKKPMTAAEWHALDSGEKHISPYGRRDAIQAIQRKWSLRQLDATSGVTTEGRTMRASEKRDYEEAQAEFDAFEELRDEESAEIARIEDLDNQRAPFDDILRGGGPRRPRKRQSETEEELRAFLHGEVQVMNVEFDGLEVHRHDSGKLEVRDLTVGSAAGGGNTVPTSFEAQLLQNLVDVSGIRQAGARVDTTPGGEDKVYPKTTSHGTASIVGEGTALPENDPSFGKVTLGSWKHAEFIEVTNELRDDSGIELVSYLAEQAGRALGLASENGYCNGTGTNEPLGVFVTAGTAVTGATGGTGVPSLNNLIDLYYAVKKPYRERGSWVMRDATAAYIRKLASASEAAGSIWGDSLADDTPSTLLGRPVYTTDLAPAYGTPAKSIAFGDFSRYIIRDVQGVRFESSADYGFNRDVTAFRAILRTDGELADLTGAIQTFRGPTT